MASDWLIAAEMGWPTFFGLDNGNWPQSFHNTLLLYLQVLFVGILYYIP